MNSFLKVLIFTPILWTNKVFAIEASAGYKKGYIPLSGSGNPFLENFSAGGGADINSVFENVYKFGIGAAIGLAIIFMIAGGIQYMTTDAINDKGEGKKKIQAALLGLLIALSSFAILNTINEDILKTELSFKGVESVPIAVPNYESVGGTEGGGGSGSGGYYNEPLEFSGKYKELPPDLREYTLQRIREMGFANLNPADAAMFFPEGVSREEGWLRLASTIMKYESGHNPNTTYTENFKDRSGNNVISTGLFQLSQESVRGYGFKGYTTETLKDPRKNIDAGLYILKNWVAKDGVISGPGNTGGARYWSVLRSTGKLNNVRADSLRK